MEFMEIIQATQKSFLRFVKQNDFPMQKLKQIWIGGKYKQVSEYRRILNSAIFPYFPNT